VEAADPDAEARAQVIRHEMRIRSSGGAHGFVAAPWSIWKGLMVAWDHASIFYTVTPVHCPTPHPPDDAAQGWANPCFSGAKQKFRTGEGEKLLAAFSKRSIQVES
jgi:hypothetical protein